MNRIIKTIRIYFLLIAGLAIVIHMILPHDHHTADSNCCYNHVCPVSDNKSGHHTGFPVHCNACNDLASEKATGLVVLKSIQNDYSLTNNEFNSSSIIYYSGGIRITDISHSHLNSELLDFSLLRAPPSLG